MNFLRHILSSILTKVGKDNHFVLVTVGILFLLFYFPQNFKLYFLVCFLVFLVSYFILKSMFLTLYFMMLVSSQFLIPGKYYSFEIIQAGKVIIEPFFSQGVKDGYGFIVSDFVVIAIVFYFIRCLLFTSERKKIIALFYKPLCLTCVSCFVIFFAVSFYSSLFVSYFQTFSIINLLQYSKMFILFFSTYYLFTYFSVSKAFFIKCMTGLIIFHSVVAFGQLFSGVSSLSQTTLNGNASSSLEDQGLLPRPSGGFLYANQLGFFIFMWCMVLLSLDFNRFKDWRWLSVFVLPVIFSQSRTVWISIVISLISLNWRRLANIHVLSPVKNKQSFVLLLAGLLFFGVIVISRLLSTRYTFEQGSGSIRAKMLQEGAQLLQLSPLFGYGINTNVIAMYNYKPDGYVKEFPFAIHNAYLQLALESGVVGSVFFFAPFFFIFFALSRLSERNQEARYMATVLLFLLLYYILQPHSGRFELPLLGIILGYCLSILDASVS